jgi:TonB family protein
MAHSDTLIAHWRRVPEYRSHFGDAASDVPPDSGVAFARYIVRLQTAIQPAFANCGSEAWRASGADQARTLQLELVLDDAGALRDIGVIASSGSASFDAAAMEAVARAARFGPTPPAVRSADGLAYLRWFVSSDPTYGCTLSARPHIQR